MKNRAQLSVFASGCISALLITNAAIAADKIEKPLNLIMIAVDDLNNFAGAWGGPAITPNIDKLAKTGTQFKYAYSVVPACNPSRVAIMTGQRPETTGQYLNEGNFRLLDGGKDRVTLPQYLRARGYYTVAAGKIFHHSRGINDNPAVLSDDVSWNMQAKTETGTGGLKEFVDEQGFGKWQQGRETFNGLPIIDYIRKHGIWGAIDTPKEKTGDFKTAQFCADFLKQKRDKPFMLACGIFRPHSPQLAPKEFFDLYPLDNIVLPEVPKNDFADIPKIAHTNWSSGFSQMVKANPDEWKRAMQGYLASTSFADAAIGVILDQIENSEYKDNTVVVLWGDHGFQLGTKDRWEKFSLWHQGGNTPFIIKAPNIKPGVTEAPVSLLDLYPTIIEILGFEPGQYLDGHSLVSLMRNPMQDWKFAAVSTYQEGNHSIRLKEWNYIRYDDGSEELYNVKKDPYEFSNLIQDQKYKAQIKKMKKFIPDVEQKQGEKKSGG